MYSRKVVTHLKISRYIGMRKKVTIMKRYFIQFKKIILIIFLQLIVNGCDDVYKPIPQNGSPETFKYLDIKFLSGSFTYNAVPVTPLEKRVHSELYLQMTNKNTSDALTGLTIPFGILYHNTTFGPLGTVYFKTDWNGTVNPGQTVTVHIISTDTSKSYIEPKCDQYVYFNLNLVADKDNWKLMVTDSMKFNCTF